MSIKNPEHYLEEANKWLEKIATDNGRSYTDTLESYSKIAIAFIEMANSISKIPKKDNKNNNVYPGY